MFYISPIDVLRTPENCAFTAQHSQSDYAQTHGAPSTASLGMPNGGLQVVNPSAAIYEQIQAHLASPSTLNFDFADQSLLSDLFGERWVALPYTYNALKTLRQIHQALWRDNEVKNIHYILTPNPWEEEEGKETQETFKWWWKVNRDRLNLERSQGIIDGF